MEKVELSIVVPVYNVSEYLERCIDSIINQTYKNWELILVDDGSTDNSNDICRKYSKENPKISLITQENQGVAVARKNGALAAKGEHLTFVDSDDYLLPDFYEQMMSNTGDFDLVTSGFIKGDVSYYDKILAGEYRTKEEMDYVIDNMIQYKKKNVHGIYAYLVNKIYVTKVANQVFMDIRDDICFSEDLEFLYCYILKCSSIKVTHICGYVYCVREGSAVNTSNRKFMRNLCDLYDFMSGVFEKNFRRESLMQQLDLWTAWILMDVTRYMGFAQDAQNVKYIFPYFNMLDGKKVVLYGAGAVGHDYMLQMQRFRCCESVLWVDKNWERYRRKNMEVSSVDEVYKTEYDYIIIAVQEEKLAETIKLYLVKNGVDENKILWHETMSVV